MEPIHIPTPFFSLNLHHMLPILVFIIFCKPTIAADAFSSNETDRFALLKLKESIVTDPQGLLNSWNESIHLCKWQGVTCNTRHQRVTALNLQSSDLHGTISPYIGNLSFLRLIDLGNNSFSGKIPQQLDHLLRLRYLNVSRNMLEGTIPTNLTFCPDLRTIHLGRNLLTGKIPSEIGLLMKLVELGLEVNNLTGGIPPFLGNLSSLTVLSLSLNNLGGSVPEGLGVLTGLSYFGISVNNLSGMIPPSLFNISSLEALSISVNNFKGSIPPGIGLSMPNLRSIYLDGNEFSGQIPASLSNTSQLQVFDMGNNNFVGQVPKIFGNLGDLVRVFIGGNNLGSYSVNDLGFITSLTNCSKLKLLDFNSNNFGGVLPNSIANLSIQLDTLYLGNNHISGMLPSTFENLKSLIVLGLNDNLFTGVIPSSLGKLQQLQRLGLQGNRLSGKIPFIANLTNLFELDLSENKLEGSIPPTSPPNLQILGLSQNRLSGDIPPDFIGSSSFTSLSLSQNSLTGSLPVQVDKLKNIRTLEISGNNLTGEIPDTIGDCVSLEFLNLQGNLFQGMIPSSLASLRGLRYLDLSRNNLSAQIPRDLQKLPFLQYLNLSFNNLEGEVPKEGVFRNASAISLVGNTKLCGGVSELHLPTCPVKISNQKKAHEFILRVVTSSSIVGFFLLSAILYVLYWTRKQKKKPLSAESSISFLSKVSYQTIFQATGGFSPSALIGSGSFGSVYKGILDREANKPVAIKILNLQQKGASKSFTAECNALRNIRHRNLVKVVTCCSSTDYNGDEFKALVFEYMSNGSLDEWLHSERQQSRRLNLSQRLNLVVDVASALDYLHDHCEPQIIHRDMKPSNVLLDDDMVAQVGDFGLARLITDSSQNQSSTVGIKGTIGYAAPEYASGVEASKQGDVYSYGILVLEMYTGRRPIDDLFKDGLDLHNFVKMAIPGRLVQILDPILLASIEETSTTATTDNEVTETSGYNHEIEAEEEEQHDSENPNAYLWNCIFPILKMGLACSEVSPTNRPSMGDVLKDLYHIQKAYNTEEIRRERPRRR